MTENLSPMLKQYFELKSKAASVILFFRMGDFYEVFGDDAKEVSDRLKLVLTAREKGDQTKIPFCGIPHHAALGYWAKLSEQGVSFAVAEQMEDPKDTKGLVKRDIVRIYTPGTFDLEDCDPTLISLYEDPGTKKCWMVLVQLATGTLRSGELTKKEDESLFSAAIRYQADEVLVRRFQTELCTQALASASSQTKVSALPEQTLRDLDAADKFLIKLLGNEAIQNGKSGLRPPAERMILASTLHYLQSLNCNLSGLTRIRSMTEQAVLPMNETLIRDLEIFETVRRKDQKFSLFSCLNQCMTAGGKRLLWLRLLHPAIDENEIKNRLDLVSFFKDQSLDLIASLRDHLAKVADLARLSNKIKNHSATPRDLLKLLQASHALLAVWTKLKGLSSEDKNTQKQLDLLIQNAGVLTSIMDTLATVLREDAGDLGRGDGVFRKGWDPELDRLNHVKNDGAAEVERYESDLRTRTNIPSLKIKEHKTFGLLIEVTKAHLHKVPTDFVRKQTMINHERFITTELVDLYETLSSGEGLACEKEATLYARLIEALQPLQIGIAQLDEAVSVLDLTLNFSWLARQRHYVRPMVSKEKNLHINGGRHPVVELNINHPFTANDLNMDTHSCVALITGPNMAGKSTVMRQTALIVLMHQIGSFVPCDEARLPVFDQIFTRIGASDDLAQGESTFYVEMKETAQVLRWANERTLVILDEIGRGTSSQDGLALAQAILKDLTERIRPFCLFATHYHELVPIAEKYANCQTLQVLVERSGAQKIRFTHKLAPGAAESSYGIEVAEIAGIPEHVVAHARESLENAPITVKITSVAGFSTPEPLQLGANVAPKSPAKGQRIDKIIGTLQRLKIDKTSPLEALNLLHDLKQSLESIDQPSLFS